MKTRAAITWPSPAPWSLSDLLKELQSLLAGRVAEAFLFGSYARGEAHGDSDIDLIVVTESSVPPLERAREFRFLWSRLGALDLLVFTPAEWVLQASSGSQVVNEAQKYWIPIF